MSFYDEIATRYDYIFPFKQSQFDFVKSEIEESSAYVMDVGCGTGELAIKLAHEGYSVYAIDLSQQLINQGKVKHGSEAVIWVNGGMKEIESYVTKKLDMLTCFGNTLVHISNRELLDFFKSAFRVLKPGGKMIFQILNYDYIYENNITELPLIDNPYIRFERYYDFEESICHFKTVLTDKETQEKFENTIELYPVRQDDLKKIISETGFIFQGAFENYDKSLVSNTKLPLIIVVSKPS